jgi:hypothetical protein
VIPTALPVQNKWIELTAPAAAEFAEMNKAFEPGPAGIIPCR